MAVGLWREGAVLEERIEPVARGAAERLFPMLEALLGAARAGVALVGVATGPGGFAASRAGVAAARGLALGLGVPARGASWLEVIGFGRAGACRAALPAGAGLIAAQSFQGGVAQGEPAALRAAGDALGAEALEGSGLAALGACIAARRACGGRPAPLYLRPPDATPAPPPPVLLA